MLCRLTDLRDKDVINVKDGTRLGGVDDVELDTATARILAVIIYGRLRWFGLLGREEDRVIRWNDIEVIGEDTILVRGQMTVARRKRNGWFRIFRGSGIG